jgi:hypothetical protein
MVGCWDGNERRWRYEWFGGVRGVFPEGIKRRVELRNKRDDEWVRIGRVGGFVVARCAPAVLSLEALFVYPRAVAFAC